MVSPPKYQFGGGEFLGSQNSKCQVLAKFQFSGGGGYSWVVKTHSTKSWPNFNLRGGLFVGSQNSKCQVLTKFQFSSGGRGVFLGSQNSGASPGQISIFKGGGGGGVGDILKLVKTQSAKSWPNFNFQRWGRGWDILRLVKPQSAKSLGSQNLKCQVLANFSLGGRGGCILDYSRIGYS